MKQQQAGQARKHSREWFDALLIAALIATILRVFVVESYRIPTGSMERTLMAGDFIFVNKFIYGAKVPFTEYNLPGFEEVERGDVIIFKFPKDRSLNYIKRCVALSGDRLEIRDRELYINGERQQLPDHAQFTGRLIPPGMVDSMIFPSFSPFNKDNYGPITVPKRGDEVELTMQTFPLYATLVADEGHQITMQNGEVFVDGVRTNSYRVEQDYYFAMGDNRDNSLDSRFWGFLPRRDILGEAIMVYWSWNPNLSLFTDPAGKLSSIRWERPGMMIH